MTVSSSLSDKMEKDLRYNSNKIKLLCCLNMYMTRSTVKHSSRYFENLCRWGPMFLKYDMSMNHFLGGEMSFKCEYNNNQDEYLSLSSVYPPPPSLSMSSSF